MLLIRSADVYAPEHIGVRDLLIAQGAILAMEKHIDLRCSALKAEEIDASRLIACPGLVDQHLHAIGGGGEAGPYSRTPEVQLSTVVSSGVTTVIGVLGTDGTSRHSESLLAKVRALETEGISAYMLTGSYELPVHTMTGDVRRDIILIDKVLGVGEIALSDHRSSQPTLSELKRLVTQARLGGMLSGKAGVVQFHMGVGEAGLSMLFRLLDETEIPARHLIPTHINRSARLMEEGMAFAKRGGYIDLTSGIRSCDGFEGCVGPAAAIRLCLEGGVPMNHVTMSSDGNGSMAVHDEEGRVQRLLVVPQSSLLEELRAAVTEHAVPLETALGVCTRNAAEANGLYPAKGALRPGSDADLLLLNPDLTLSTVVARGRVMLHQGRLLARGTFE